MLLCLQVLSSHSPSCCVPTCSIESKPDSRPSRFTLFSCWFYFLISVLVLSRQNEEEEVLRWKYGVNGLRRERESTIQRRKGNLPLISFCTQTIFLCPNTHFPSNSICNMFTSHWKYSSFYLHLGEAWRGRKYNME